MFASRGLFSGPARGTCSDVWFLPLPLHRRTSEQSLMRFLFSGEMVNQVVPCSVLLLPAALVFVEPPSVPYAIFVLLFSCLQEGSGSQAD